MGGAMTDRSDGRLGSVSTLGSPRLISQMRELTGSPITAAAGTNVAWLDTIRGAGVLLTLGAAIWSFAHGKPALFWFVLIVSLLIDGLAWLGMRRRARPLRLPLGGGVFGATDSTLYYAPSSIWTGRPSAPVQVWPREDAVLIESDPFGARRLLTVRFRGAGQRTRLEIRGSNKDALVDALFWQR